MKKSVAGMMLGACLFSVLSAQAESVTGFIFCENGKYWRVGKAGGNGQNIATAILPMEESSKVSSLEGKTVKITGELDPSSKMMKFKPGFTVEVIE